MPLAAASFLPAFFALPALAERLASLWPFLLPLGALILAVAGLSLAQEASYYRALDGYRERVGAVVGRTWTLHGAGRVHLVLAPLRCLGETAVQRRRRRRAELSPKHWPDFEVAAVFRDPNFGQSVQLDFLSAASVADAVRIAAATVSADSPNRAAGHSGLHVHTAEGVVVAASATLLLVVRPAPAPIRLWLFRRWG